MNEIMEKENINIEDKIYKINGIEVMLDSDLAELYHVETKRINEAVKNNPDKFPKRYSWQLSIKETEETSRSKFSTLKLKQGFNVKYGARVFTEQGVYMLATILKTKIAIEVSIRIMDTFVKMRHYINYTQDLLPHKILLIESKLDEHSKKIDELFDKFNSKVIAKDYVFFHGEYYDAYSLVQNILKSAKKKLVIVDGYADKNVLDIIKELKANVKIITKPNNLLKKSLVKQYNKQYNNLEVVYNDTFHDRYFILDEKIVYHCGTSLNKIGRRTFSISLISDKNICNSIINEVKAIE